MFTAEFYTIRSRVSGCHLTGLDFAEDGKEISRGHTQNIDKMLSFNSQVEALTYFIDNKLSESEYYICKFTMNELDNGVFSSKHS